MAFTEVTTQGWGSRIGGSIKGALFGVVLFLAGFPILFMNEGRAVKTAKSLKEGQAAVVSIQPATIDPANEGKLVHFSGLVDSTQNLSDPDFGIDAKALKLVRKVEMYQWVEEKETTTREKAGGSKETTTTYNYVTKWSDDVINSSSFKESDHDNPTQMRYVPRESIAQDAKLGAFAIPARLVDRMSSTVDLPMEEGKFKVPGSSSAAPATAAADPTTATTTPGAAPASTTVTVTGSTPKIDNGKLYFGNDPASPQVGDTRVSFLALYPAEASIIARQTGSTVDPYPTKAGKPLEFLEMGIKDAAAMFETQERNNMVLTWVLRVLGFLAMFFGLSLLFQPLVMVAKFIPFLGSLLNVGVSLFAGAIAFVCALITVAIAWIFFRPVLGILLLVVAVGAIVAIYKMPGRVKINEPDGEPAPAGA